MTSVHFSEIPNAYARKDAEHIAHNLRESERLELALCGMDPMRTIPMINEYTSEGFIAYLRHEPVFAFGGIETYRHHRAIFGYGTKKAWRAVPEITRFITDTYLPKMRAKGVTRGELRILQSMTKNIKWLKGLGFEVECTLPGLSLDPDHMFLQMAVHSQGNPDNVSTA